MKPCDTCELFEAYENTGPRCNHNCGNWLCNDGGCPHESEFDPEGGENFLSNLRTVEPKEEFISVSPNWSKLLKDLEEELLYWRAFADTTREARMLAILRTDEI